MAESEVLQTHPLYAKDRNLVDRLLAVTVPEDQDLVDLARLAIRYEGFPGAHDLKDDLIKTLRFWGLEREQLNQRARAIWAAGHRPGALAQQEPVGSGFDTADQASS